MAHSKSAKKRVRQNEASRLRNRRRTAIVKDTIREFDAAVAAKDAKAAGEKLPDVYSKLDKLAAKNTIHKKTAARKKSRLAKQVSELAAK